MAGNFRQGQFVPTNPQKYRGNLDKIIYRSSWELAFCRFLDNNPNILEWASEEIAIPYVKPTDGKVHRYFPDFWVKYKDRNGNVLQELIEVKPSTQATQPKRTGKNKKTQLYEDITYAINLAKWAAATNFCNKNGLKFRVLTEKSLFL